MSTHLFISLLLVNLTTTTTNLLQGMHELLAPILMLIDQESVSAASTDSALPCVSKSHSSGAAEERL